MINLSGETAIVTGASRGIGAATAKKLFECGANVVLAARNLPQIEQNAADLHADDHAAAAIQCDVSNYDDVARAVEFAKSRFGTLSILVNNAGVIDPIARISDTDPMAWSHAIDVNIKGVYHGLRAALPMMEANERGVIVNLSSGAANSALEGWSHYCAGKAAVKKLTECAHQEVAKKGVRVVGLSPGTVATDMMAQIKESGINPVSQLDWKTHIPAEWAAAAVAFLCGPEGGELAGSDFSIKTEEGRRHVGLLVDGVKH